MAGSGKAVVKYLKQDFSALKSQYMAQQELFSDPTFPAEAQSLGFKDFGPNSYKVKSVEWKRPKEITNSPQFIVEGATRTDICQGELGDCWLMAAVASLTLNQDILARVIHPEQNFTEDYVGIFHFQLWQYGCWLDVVIDDRLPTKDGKLLFVHSADRNEFWSALLEKAYAKVNGCYEALSGGSIIEGFEDFTGGIAESYELRKAPPTLFNIIRKALSRGSLLGCSIDVSNSSETEAVTRQKLVKGHAYSVTGAEEVLMYEGSTVQLVRLRNPWGKVEWTGAWSDHSKEWDQVQPEQKAKLNHSADDGEFWMAYSDFIQHYLDLEICNLTPDTVSCDSVSRWNHHQFEGTWRVGSTAGGCRNNPDTFCSNPQFVIKLEEVDDDPYDGINGCSFVVGLMQKRGSNGKQYSCDFNTIGFAIYRVPDEFTGLRNIRLESEDLLHLTAAAMSDVFTNKREVCTRFLLPPGEYVIIPSTFEPHRKGNFILRVFTEKLATASPVETDIKANIKQEENISEHDVDPNVKNFFELKAKIDSEMSATELQKILDKTVYQRTDLKMEGFSLETCRNIISLLDRDGNGTLGLQEFHIVCLKLQRYQEIFKRRDMDHSGTMSSFEMRKALAEAGFQINTQVLEVIISRYADQKRAIDFDSFVSCLIRLEMLFQTFRTADYNNTGKIELNIGQWFCLALL